jgi:hypothetical protein
MCSEIRHCAKRQTVRAHLIRMKIAINLVIFLLILSTFFYFNNRRTNKILSELIDEFPPITISEKLDGKISLIYNGDPKVFRNNRHHAYIILDDTIYRSVNTDYELNTQQTFDDIIEYGARFMKDSNDSYIRIQKANDSIYSFELRDNLGYPLK